MNFIRLLLGWLVLVIIVVALLVAVAFVPMVHTWAAQMELSGKSGIHGSIGSFSAGFGSVDASDLHLESNGAILTLPSAQAALPLTMVIWKRKLLIRSLVAKGWTLDLTHALAPAVAPASAVSVSGKSGTGMESDREGAGSAQIAARVFQGLLGGWRLPFDGTLNGVDLEGEVLVSAQPGRAPTRVRVVIKGDLPATGEGAFAVEASSEVMDSGLRIITLAAHGRLVLARESPRTFSRVGFKGDFSAVGGSLPANVVLSADAGVARGVGEESYTLALGRGSRQLVSLLARSNDTTFRLAGAWKLDVRDSDLAPFAREVSWPSITLAGAGDFDADAAWTRLHAVGRVRAVESRWGDFGPAWDRFGALTLDARFDLSAGGESVRVDRLSASLGGSRPIAEVQALQAFDVDLRTGKLKLADPRGDCLAGSIKGLPLAWLSGLTGRYTVSGGDVTGDFLVKSGDGGFTLHPKTPLTATGVSVRGPGKTLAQGLDLTLAWSADYAPQGWQVQWAPLAVASGGRPLATIEGKASRQGGADEPIAVTGKWKADFTASALPEFPWMAGRLASGDYSASWGEERVVQGSFAMGGLDPGRSLTGSVRANLHADGAVSFFVPIKIAFGSSVSDVSAEGTWAEEAAGPRIDLKLSSENVALDRLRLLAAPLAAAGGASWPPRGGTVDRTRDRIPFWGDWRGRLTVAFDRLQTRDGELTDVGGAFDVGPDSIRLEFGRGGLPHHPPAKVEGLLSFQAAAEWPYSLKATTGLDQVEAAPLFAASAPGQESMVEGRFALACTLTGNGRNLDDLIGRTQEEFRLTSASTGGILRLMKTSVAEAIPQVSTPVKDTVGGVGSFLAGSIFGVKGSSLQSNTNPISPNAEAVLDFTTAISEIGYDRITVTAVRASDGTIRLNEITMAAPDERLTGTGEIGCVQGRPLAAQPLSLDLRFSARGDVAGLLQKAGLISAPKDKQGFAPLNQPIHFGGTLGHIDSSQWHDLLAKAATRKPEPDKKAPAHPAGAAPSGS